MNMNAINLSHPLRGFMATAIFCALAASLGAASAAAPQTGSVSLSVKYSDLDPSSPAGAAELYHRINVAAVSACSYFWFKSDKAEARCVRDAIANAVTNVNEPALFAIYNAANRDQLPASLVSRSH
jgi:UrcA family protein